MQLQGIVDRFIVLMRVLLVHNYYGSGSPSGENVEFEAEKDLLEKNGDTVFTFTRHSDELKKSRILGYLQASMCVPWNYKSARDIQKDVERIEPDIVHVHNSFPLISPSVFHALDKKVPKVLTLHNFRLLCPAAIPVRDGKVCTRCMDERSVVPSLRYGCYRGSRLATLPLAINVGLHRSLGTWQDKVDAFVALTEFQKEAMVKGGLPIGKLYVKPNFYSGSPKVVPMINRSNDIVYVGRLSSEKGLNTLVRAWKKWGEAAPRIKIVGDGPMKAELELLSKGANIEFLGQLSGDAAQQEISLARLLILPSECFEGFPMVLREAFAFGTPAVVSNLGPLPSIVSDDINGVVFEAGNAASLLSSLIPLVSNLDKLDKMSLNARKSFDMYYNEEINYKTLMHIYSKAIDSFRDGVNHIT